MNLWRNLSLALSTATAHLSDDPVLLSLQISRRLPAGLVSSVAKFLTRSFPRSTSTLVLLASCIAGDKSGVDSRLRHAAESGISGTRARRAVDVALASGSPEWADQILPLASGSKLLPATVARRKWYDGDMQGAIDALAGEPGVMRKQLARLVGEQRTFSGWTPELPPTAMMAVKGRVLHLLTNSLPHTSSGYAQRSHSILLAQQDAGREVLAVTRLGYPVQVGKLLAADEDVIDGVRYARLIPVKLAHTPDARLQQEAEELLKVALEFKPEILHTTSHFLNGLVVSAVAKALGIPWVYEVRGQLADTWASTRSEQAKTSERYVLFRGAESRVMQDADAVVTLGTVMLNGIVSQGIPVEKIILAPNAVGGDFLLDPVTPEIARGMLGLDPTLNYIGTVSSLVDYEGLDHLIDAFSILEPTFPKLRLLLVGGGTAVPALQTQAAALQLSEKIIFAGRVPREQTSLYHQALDIFVVPRKDLNVTRAVTPLKPVEALASSRPVVASDLPALREIVEDGVNGRLCPAGDPQILASTLLSLLQDEPARLRFGREGRRGVLEGRTWAANAQRCEAKYKELLMKLNKKETSQ